MTNIKKCTNCMGCSACINICPKNAIIMQEDINGFMQPVIDENKCTKCSLCEKVCPSLNPDFPNTNSPKFYAAMANDELRNGKSASGAIFPIIAKTFIDTREGGQIYGARFDETFRYVYHCSVDNVKDLEHLKGSKYVQSDMKNCFKEIKESLNSGIRVLFSGTPCQVAGLKGFLGKEYENLYTLDIICHGVPSTKVYRKYLNEYVNNERIVNINFRDKSKQWYPYNVSITTDSGFHSLPVNEDMYMKAFLSNLSMRESCHNCPFHTLSRQGDVSLGDFWGIELYNSNYDDKKGTSLVLVNNEKGTRLIKSVESELKLLKEVPPDAGLKYQHSLKQSSEKHKNRNIFFKKLDNYTLKETVELSLEEKFEIGIMNVWFTNNYGAMLTAYASQELLKSQGYLPKIIKFIPEEYYLETYYNDISENFADKYLDMTSLYKNYNELQNINNLTNTFFIGSDQLWRYVPEKWHDCFYLDFADGNKKKIAHSVSFGPENYPADWEHLIYTKYFVQQFDHISVRENNAVNMCKELFGCTAEHILDPLIIADKSIWTNLTTNAKDKTVPEITSYILDETKEIDKMLDYISNRLNKSITNISNRKLATEDWLYKIENCELLVTDSFHGLCFAIIFNKPFICLLNQLRGTARIKSILNTFNLHNHYIKTPSDIKERDDLFAELDYTHINQILESERLKHINWVINAVETPQKPLSQEKEIINVLAKKLSIIENGFSRLNTMSKLLPQKKKIFGKDYRYKILSKITTGKVRTKYKNKLIFYKQLVSLIKNMER